MAENAIKVDLYKRDIDFLKEKYSDVPIVKRILEKEHRLHFQMSEDDFIDFLDWLQDASVAAMSWDYEPTDESEQLIGIYDYLYWQDEHFGGQSW